MLKLKGGIKLEKSNVKNKIKMICTNKTIPIEGKGTNDYEVPNFSKLIKIGRASCRERV